MLRICLVASAGSVHTQRWVKYLSHKGHDVHLISPTPFGSTPVENVKLHLLPPFKPQIRGLTFLVNAFRCIRRTRRLIMEIKPDILHAHYVTDCGLWGAASGFHPFFLSAWGSDILVVPYRRLHHKILTKYTLRRADLVHIDADHMIGALMKLGVRREKISLVYYGTDTRKFNAQQKDKTLLQELNVFGSPTIISIRNLKPIYDVESLIKAVPLVLEEMPEAKFIIGGDGEQKEYLQELAESLGISEKIRFVGSINNQDLPRYLASSDIYVSTSLSDGGLASSTAEAMACELPVVITDFGDNRKWVKEGVNGFLISLKNPEALALKIIDLLRSKEKREEFGRVNRQMIVEKSNWETEMGKIVGLYHKLIAEHKGQTLLSP